MRPALPPFARFVATTGFAFGAIEVALRASPMQGLGLPDVVQWLGISIVLSIATAALAGVVAWGLNRGPYGLFLGAMLGLWASVNYRFEIVLNEFVRDPKVWAAMPAIFLVWLGLGFVLDSLLRASARTWSATALVVGVLASALAIFHVRPAPGRAGILPSVLLISMDTTRPDRLGAYGHKIATPHLDRLAAEGVTFDNAIASAPITEPSHLAMLTGIAPYVSGILSNGTDLGDRPALLWHALREKEFLNAGFVAGFPLHGKYGWNQGMDVWDDDFGATAGVQTLTLVKAWNQVAIKEHALRERPAHEVLSRAVPWLRAHKEDQFFAFVHFYDAHGPYEAPANTELGPPPTNGEPLALPPYWPAPARAITSPAWLEKAYDKEIELVDSAVGELLAALGDRLDHTLVIVTADHGESLTEHEYYFDHGDNLYDPSLRVPLIVRYPDAARRGHRVPCQVAGVDVAPTILDILGVDDGIPRNGRSLKAALGGADCTETEIVSSTVAGRFVEKPPVSHALRSRTEKFVMYEDKGPELFDLLADPGETASVYATSPRGPLVEAAMKALLASGGSVVSAEMDAETQQMLEQLGYLEAGGTP